MSDRQEDKGTAVSDRSGNDRTHGEEAEGRHSRRTFVSHAAPAAAAAAAAVGISIAVDNDAPERTRPTGHPGVGLVYDVTHYGAQGDGQTDDTDAIQRAINDAKAARGGVVFFPVGTYVAGGLAMNETFGVILLGEGSGQHSLTPAARLLFNGASGNLLTIHSSSNWQLLNLGFWYSNSAYRGNLIDVGWDPQHPADCQVWTIDHCSSRYPPKLYGPARSIIRLDRAIYGSIVNSHWTGAADPLLVGDPDYVNVVQIEKCTFNYCTDAYILFGTADGESLVVRDCGFETTNCAIKGTSANQLYNLLIEGCWFGDAGAGTTWVDNLTSILSCAVKSCRFASASKHLVLNNDSWIGKWHVEDCSFQNGIVFSTNTSLENLTVIANVYAVGAAGQAVFDPAKFPKGHPTKAFVSLGNTVPPYWNHATPTPPAVKAAAENRILPAPLTS